MNFQLYFAAMLIHVKFLFEVGSKGNSNGAAKSSTFLMRSHITQEVRYIICNQGDF